MWGRYKKLSEEIENLRERVGILENPPSFKIGDKVFLDNFLVGTKVIVTDVKTEYKEYPFLGLNRVFHEYEVIPIKGKHFTATVSESELTTKKPKKDGN